MTTDQQYMQAAIAEAFKGMNANAGGPFGAVVVKGDRIVGRGHNQVTSRQDPTAHAEVVAIRDACKQLNDFQLTGCTLYSSCEPCPMCLGAIYWARPSRVVFGCTHAQAAAVDFDDSFIYHEIVLPVEERQIPMEQVMAEEAWKVFEAWQEKADKQRY